ncbi:hypothetical protein TIFTF001_023110 [Ficus carica]|uniref:Uncharacterized protein n=1 Tax=Ficus carica TaxID=3494 RepID=A0AA88AMZ4_FICCA|nr:hypothetical protein TIFTF001_023110 [Ficus carica]
MDELRSLITLRYGPLLGEGFDVLYRDHEIYADMYRKQYANYVAAWRAYPNESMGHYCQRFRDAMLPYTPLGTPKIQTLCILRGGLPPEIMRFAPIAAPEMTLDEMIEVIIDAEILANWVWVVPEVPAPMFEDDHPFVPMDNAGMDDAEMDPADQQADPEEDPEDPLVIIIASDDEDEIKEEVEEEFEEDPEEILFNDDEEWDVFSDVTTE